MCLTVSISILYDRANGALGVLQRVVVIFRQDFAETIYSQPYYAAPHKAHHYPTAEFHTTPRFPLYAAVFSMRPKPEYKE
jgi:hypothetical protein